MVKAKAAIVLVECFCCEAIDWNTTYKEVKLTREIIPRGGKSQEEYRPGFACPECYNALKAGRISYLTDK